MLYGPLNGPYGFDGSKKLGSQVTATNSWSVGYASYISMYFGPISAIDGPHYDLALPMMYPASLIVAVLDIILLSPEAYLPAVIDQ